MKQRKLCNNQPQTKMAEIIYDTLFENREYKQFDIVKVGDSEIDYQAQPPTITFRYGSRLFQLACRELK